jgi:hypothetical protein
VIEEEGREERDSELEVSRESRGNRGGSRQVGDGRIEIVCEEGALGSEEPEFFRFGGEVDCRSERREAAFEVWWGRSEGFASCGEFLLDVDNLRSLFRTSGLSTKGHSKKREGVLTSSFASVISLATPSLPLVALRYASISSLAFKYSPSFA